MSVLVIGADDYIGFYLSMHLANNVFDVVGVDNFLRRRLVAEVGSHSVTPVKSMMERLVAFERTFGKKLGFEPKSTMDDVLAGVFDDLLK